MSTITVPADADSKIAAVFAEMSTSTDKDVIAERNASYFTKDCCRRYLSANRWDVTKALASCIASAKWRQQNGVSALTIDSPGFDECVKMMCMYWNGYDPEGRPVLYFRMRRHNASVPRATRIKFFVYITELGTRLMNPEFSGKDGVEQWVILADEKGKSSSNNDFMFLKALATPMFSHYVERLRTTIIASPSLSFSVALKIVNAVIDSRTRAKLKTAEKMSKYAPNVHPVIAEVIPASHLETDYGGKVPELSVDAFIALCRRVDAWAAEKGLVASTAGAVEATYDEAVDDDADIAAANAADDAGSQD